MIAREDRTVRMIPVDRITVLNPRARGRTKFGQITENIAKIGLKKPVTVARSRGGIAETEYVLVCGQGRLEAYRALGQTEIPAVVITGTKADFLLMSLAENLARRQHGPVELVKQIRILKQRGYSFSEIAKKTDLGTTYVRSIVQLLEAGEEALVRAVERGKIPVTVAITIAGSDDKAIQKALTEAYESNSLRGKQLLAARRLIEKRRIKEAGGRAGASDRTVSAEELLRTYERETLRQRSVIQKANLCETRLRVAVAAFRQLLADDNFTTLLRAESLDSLPRILADLVEPKGEAA